MKPKFNSRLFTNSAAISAVIFATLASPSVLAATVTWDGGPLATGTDLGLAENWAGDVVPSTATPDTALWDGTVTGPLALVYTTNTLGGVAGNTGINLDIAATQTNTLNLDSGLNASALRINNITLNSGAGAFSLGNSSDVFNLTLGGAGGQTHTWSNNSANLATVASDVAFGMGGAGIHTLALSGSGNWLVNKAFAPISSSLNLLKTGAGTATLSAGGTLTGNNTNAHLPGSALMPMVVREGTLLLTGGTLAVTGEATIGGVVTNGGAGQNAKIQLDAGSFTVSSWLSVGRGNGIGGVSSDLVLNNASTVTAGNFSAGYNAGDATNLPKGSITLNGTSSLSVTGTVHLGENTGSDMTLTLNDNATFAQTSTSGGQTNIATNAGANATVTINGGTFTSERDLVMANAGGNATLTISGGTLNVASASERWFKVGQGAAGGSIAMTMSNGIMNLNTNSDIRFAHGTFSGTSVFTLSGTGTIQGWTGNKTGSASLGSIIDLDYQSGVATSTFNLNGGTLTIGQIVTSVNTGTATFNFGGGTLKAAGNTNNFVDLGGANQKAYVQSGGAIIDTNTFNVAIPEPLLAGSPSGGLTKNSAGNLTLSGANTYTGATLVSGGTLTVSGSGAINTSSGVTINGSGAKLVQSNFGAAPTITLTQGTVESNGTVSSLTVANSASNTINPGAGTANSMIVDAGLTFSGAAVVNLGANGEVMEQFIEPSINATMALTTPGDGAANGQVTLNVSNTGIWAGNTDYPLIGYSSFTGVLADFTLGTVSGLSPRQTPSLVNTGSAIALHITGDSLRWTGAKNSDWTTVAVGTPYNWVLPSDSSDAEFLTGDVVLFDDNTSNFAVNVAENVTPGAVAFNNSTDYTVSSTGAFGIVGGASVLKNNTGKVTITTNNSYTGTTTINDGILEIGGTGSIASSSSIINNASLILNNTNANTYANPISGSGSVTKQGVGTLTLSGASTFAGNFTLDAGQLNLNSAGALGAGPGTITINGGTLDNTSGGTINMTPNKAQIWNTDITFVGSNALYMSNGEVTLPATRTVNVQAGIFGTGAVVDAGSGYNLVKTGAGKLVLNGGDIDGNLDIQTGIVGINQDFLGGAPIGTGILQNDGAVGTKWTFWYGPADVSSNVLIRNNDGSNTRQLGIVKRGTGTLTLTNASNVATNNLSVDSGRLVLSGVGTYGAQNDDGTTYTGHTALVGNTAAANGVLEINGAGVNYNNRSTGADAAFRSTLNVGNNGTGAGALKLATGSLTTNRQLALGSIAGAFGAMTQTGGTTNVGGFLALGLGASQGVLNLTGGTYTQAGPVTNGASAGSTGLINIGGTAAYSQTGIGDLGLWVGENGTGILNVSGTSSLSIVSGNNGLQLGRNASGVGTVNLRGGIVTTKAVGKGAGAGTLNFNGGTLAANIANASFLTGLNAAYVHSGGGTIDNGGNAITIGQALLAPTGNGVSAFGLIVGGGGYIDTPIVAITGDGTGATAVANIDGSGNLTGITITNPGVNYTTSSVTLVGGGIGNTGSIGGATTTALNASGGMTFSGAAITTLTGVNTYTGNTTVSTGSTLALADNAGLKFVIGGNGVNNKITGTGTATLDGDFTLDLGAAAIANGNSWTLVDTTTKSFTANFTVAGGFTESSNVWTLVDGTKTWTFTEADGKLTLAVAGGANFASWVSGFGLAAGDQDPTDDPDNDGLKNIVEYVLGGNPSVSDASIKPTGSKVGTDYVFTFKRSDLSEGDTTQFVEYGNDLTVWGSYAIGASPGIAPVAIAEDTPTADLDTVTVTIPTAGATKFFARLKVVKP